MSMLLLCSKTAANLCGSFGVKIVFFYVFDCNSAFHYSSNMSTKKSRRKINIVFFFGGKLKEQNRKRKIISILSYVIWYNVVLSHYRTFRNSKIAASWPKIYRFPVYVHDEEKICNQILLSFRSAALAYSTCCFKNCLGEIVGGGWKIWMKKTIHEERGCESDNWWFEGSLKGVRGRLWWW